MPKDTGTEKKTRRSFLCKKMSFTIPSSWEELTQQQLRFIFRLLAIYNTADDWEYRVKLTALIRFCNIRVEKRTRMGWLCQERKTKKVFLLDERLLPSLVAHVDYLCQLDLLNVRLEQFNTYRACDFELQELMFGEYLEAENYFQSFLQTNKEESLKGLVNILYGIKDDENVRQYPQEILYGAFLWFSAAKMLLGKMFPHFLKPSEEASGQVTQETLMENMRAQIRLLTKGDVTKNKYILEKTETWEALAELDALAQEAEEIKQRYGK